MEELSLVEDYMGEEGGKERHGLRKTYDIESSKGEGDVANPPQEEVQCVRRGLPGGRVQAVRRGQQGVAEEGGKQPCKQERLRHGCYDVQHSHT